MLKAAACPNWEQRMGLLEDSNAIEGSWRGCWPEDDSNWGSLLGLLLADTNELLEGSARLSANGSLWKRAASCNTEKHF